MPKKTTSESNNQVKIQTYLAGMDYPASKDDLVDYADSKEAPDDVLDVLKDLPDQDYETTAAVMKEVGQIIS